LHSGFMAGAGSNWKICTFIASNNPIGNIKHWHNPIFYTRILKVTKMHLHTLQLMKAL
jgi:hypothetical protein